MQLTSTLREFDPDEIRCNPDNSEIGSGNYGNVVLGHHESFDALAIKIFKIGGGNKDKQLITKRFQKEIGHLQQANHESIVRVFGHVKWPCALGIVMEYCPAGNLRQFILDPDIPVGISLSIRMLTDVASAIAFIHNMFDDKRLIHLDIKPENILLTVELRCKVGDLGSAEVITLSGLTTTTAIGSKGIPAITPLYTPPERLRDMSILPRKEHDTYGYGIVTYVVVARAPPYPAGDQETILGSIKNGTRPNLSLVEERLQNLDGRDRASLEHVVELMKKCWGENPQERPNMVDAKNSMLQLLHQQDCIMIRNQVENSLQKMEIKDSFPQNQNQLIPLHYFSTRTGRFEITEGRPSNAIAVTTTTTANPAHEQETDEIAARVQLERPTLRRRKLQNLQAPRPTIHNSENSRKCGVLALAFSSLALSFCLMGFLMLSKPTPPINNPRDGALRFIADVFGENKEIAMLADEHKRFLSQYAFDEAAQKHDLLLKFIDSQTNTTAMQVKQLADQLGNSKHYLEAILFYEISLNLFVKHPVGEASVSGFASCLLALTKACQHMIEYERMTPLVGKLTIAEEYAMPRISNGIPELKKFKGLTQMQFNLFLMDCNLAKNQLFGSITKYRHKDVSSRVDKIVKSFEENKARLGPQPYKSGKYSELLNDLGEVCENSSHLDEAINYYTQAIHAIKRAEDVSEACKKEQLGEYEKNLQRVKKLLN